MSPIGHKLRRPPPVYLVEVETWTRRDSVAAFVVGLSFAVGLAAGWLVWA